MLLYTMRVKIKSAVLYQYINALIEGSDVKTNVSIVSEVKQTTQS
jgi:hypothetical protein